ncbi:MAG: hypothetical protein K0S02_1661 [Achromobacter mucicolens]|nr:hypothetical protein [Achromobacter mucicolens]
MAFETQRKALSLEPKGDRFVSHNDIAERLRLNPAHVRDRLTKRSDFPRPFLFGGARRWKEEEVLDWIESSRLPPDGRRHRR